MTYYFRQLEDIFKAFQYSQNTLEKEQLFANIMNVIRPKLMMKFRMLGIDHQELEDLIQDTSLKIYLALHTFNFNTNVPFEHYLNRLVYSVKKDFWRKRYAFNQRQQLLINECVVESRLNQMIKRTEELYLTRSSKEELIDSFKKLSMFEREVANLLLLDYSPSEIAKRLNVKDKVVYNSIQRCKIKMKQYLLKYKR
ncbi:sigma-70 family RNA polymerase sigma factor [Staphylococcus hominis]|uniref:sigma-70 family RNA polymerase sigma factor n=1 Tax=Staphylococcus hominis TaxID=1290 RepID=UPI001F5A8CE9|nr:sigma-70 family RNA polymerase sigma factor [Staphylococcus hominis]MCI2902410.1 sigma-70 family RNA polymerase sigma factor [Staphylococcus hominis]